MDFAIWVYTRVLPLFTHYLWHIGLRTIRVCIALPLGASFNKFLQYYMLRNIYSGRRTTIRSFTLTKWWFHTNEGSQSIHHAGDILLQSAWRGVRINIFSKIEGKLIYIWQIWYIICMAILPKFLIHSPIFFIGGDNINLHMFNTICITFTRTDCWRW